MNPLETLEARSSTNFEFFRINFHQRALVFVIHPSVMLIIEMHRRTDKPRKGVKKFPPIPIVHRDGTLAPFP